MSRRRGMNSTKSWDLSLLKKRNNLSLPPQHSITSLLPPQNSITPLLPPQHSITPLLPPQQSITTLLPPQHSITPLLPPSTLHYHTPTPLNTPLPHSYPLNTPLPHSYPLNTPLPHSSLSLFAFLALKSLWDIKAIICCSFFRWLSRKAYELSTTYKIQSTCTADGRCIPIVLT